MPPQALYQAVYSDLIRRLDAGEWRIGDKFPTVYELMDFYKFSHRTILRGIQQLASEGYLKVCKGRSGSFVAQTKCLQNIGLLVKESLLSPQKTPFHYVLGMKIEALLKKEGFSVLRYIERPGTEFAGTYEIENFSKALTSGFLSGMIFASCDFPFYMDKCPVWQKGAVPSVAIGRYGTFDFKVIMDNEELFRIAFEYFQKKGRKNIAVFGSDIFRDMAEQKIKSFPRLQQSSNWYFEPERAFGNMEESGYKMMMRLWQEKNHPDALLVTDDIITKGVIQAATKLGIRVPAELMIIHEANSDADIFYPVQMPRIEYNLDEIARAMVETLRSSMAASKAKSKAVKKFIYPRLVEISQQSKGMK